MLLERSTGFLCPPTAPNKRCGRCALLPICLFVTRAPPLSAKMSSLGETTMACKRQPNLLSLPSISVPKTVLLTCKRANGLVHVSCGTLMPVDFV